MSEHPAASPWPAGGGGGPYCVKHNIYYTGQADCPACVQDRSAATRNEFEGVVELTYYGDDVEINVGGVDVGDFLEACEGKQVRIVIEVAK